MIRLINQPSDGQFGNILQDELSHGQYNKFVIVSAFAKNSGVLRLKDSLKQFREGGGKVEAYIGLDAHGTSYEAVLNLLSLVDELFIVHDNSPSTTFHSKIYYLSNSKNDEWIAVGSNNLTGGGMWTNIESCTIFDSRKCNTDTSSYFDSYKKFIKSLKDSDCKFSLKINTIEDIDELLDVDLLRHEIRLQIDAATSRRNFSKKPINIFGSRGKVNIPKITDGKRGKKITIKEKNEEITSKIPIAPSNISEKMWFETGKMTGGSRNILDLSMLGRLVEGSGNHTRYETDKSNFVLGSVVFFDLNPTDITSEKNITINYNAKDYVGCTIKMHQTGANPNGSWRIQLKGETTSGEKLTTAEDGKWLVQKIIVLEKIQTDYYVMSVLSESEAQNIIFDSIFVATNGTAANSKRYGLLDI